MLLYQSRMMPDPDKLRQFASWDRDFAERATNPMIWEARLLTADLDRHADRIEESAPGDEEEADDLGRPRTRVI